jgi:predicted phosphodiesterase
MKIEIIGSVDGQCHHSEQQIATLLNAQRTELNYGAMFMGRPSTSLYVNDTAVIKLRSELDLNENRGRRFVNHTLQQEQKLKVHHPHKTWFLLQQDDDKFKIGNICPRLIPLHTLGHQSLEQIAIKMGYLEKIYRCYFYTASEFGARLDEGLSNFGIDSEERLYYLDDDIYVWDNFISFTHLLGVLIRNNPWLDEKLAVDFGGHLQHLIAKYFTDSHTNVMVARKLRDIYMPDNSRRAVLEIIIEQLQQQKVISKQVIAHRQEYIAILSDIHANFPALQAVLAYLKAHNIHQGMVLGDTVGYGPHPGECIERLQETELTVIKGNHDHAAVAPDNHRGMSKIAKWCIDWTIPRLTANQKQWLADLPLELNSADGEGKKWQAMHGAPIDPNYFYAYVYQMTYEENLDILVERGVDLCFHGHSHIQGLYARNTLGLDGFIKPEGIFSLDDYKHALICSGAVGQPRDGVVGAQFALYNQRTYELQFVMVDYAMDKTIKDMQAYGFPETLWERLRRGT